MSNYSAKIMTLCIKQSHFVWIVFNIKRILTKDTMDLMQSESFLRQIIMDGRANALTFVGTASDDIEPESGREEFGIHEEAEDVEIIRARNAAVRKEVMSQLQDLSTRIAKMAEMAGERPKQAEELKGAFLASKVFTVSAREYLRLVGVSKSRASGIDQPEDTEIPDLKQHMFTTCEGYGVEAHFRILSERLKSIKTEIEREVATQKMLLEQQYRLDDSHRKEVVKAAESAHYFLANGLTNLAQDFEQELIKHTEKLNRRLKIGREAAEQSIDDAFSQIHRMHWCTLRATSRRKGRFVSSSSGEHDIPELLAKPLMDMLTFSWIDHFGDTMNDFIDSWAKQLQDIDDEHRRKQLYTAT